MKILLVDDESRKLKRLKGIINKLEGIADNNIIHVLDLNSAKNILKQQQIDLMVLDLIIPEILGDDFELNGIAGLDFVDEIIAVDTYFKPKDIIIVTEYDDLIEKCCDPDKGILFPVLKYDESSNEWERLLTSKIKYGLISKKSRKFQDFSYDYDVAIITAVELETRAVNRLYGNWQKYYNPNDPTNYYINEFYNSGKKLKIVTAQQRDPGMAAAATLTGKMLMHFKPKYILMVGIAAGVGGNKNFGDIIIADEVWNYSSGKYIAGNEGEDMVRFLPDPKSISLDRMLLGQVSIDYSDVLFQIKKNWIESVNHDLKLVIGPLACGTAVIANEEIVKQLIQAHSRKTVGLDMESYGMFYSVCNGTGLKTTPLCLKSISDFADHEKGDFYQNYAAYTSANFAKYLIENVLKFA